ncbi:hypothetical protein [Methylomonas koyamae]|uniref:hypothetical protein n=1 Tax=Methylomonas koyamae TaxID=702114 RepID=UPI0006CF4BCE|nr:hypothetical protein [Methylomonas koyamae]
MVESSSADREKAQLRKKRLDKVFRAKTNFLPSLTLPHGKPLFASDNQPGAEPEPRQYAAINPLPYGACAPFSKAKIEF